MKLKAKYSSKDQIPAEYVGLYSEQNGEWVLSEVEGIKTQEDVDRVMSSLEKERNDHKETKAKLKPFTELGVEPEELATKLDKYSELETLAEGKGLDEKKVDELVEARIKSRLGPIERENKKLKEESVEKDQKLGDYETKDRRRVIGDALKEAGMTQKVRQEAMDDILLYGDRMFDIEGEGDNARVVTRDGVGVTPGVSPEVWLTDMQKKRPHWWPESSGGNSRGSGGGNGPGTNPFAKETWNLTAQGQLHRENPEQAQQMAKAAGVKL